VTEPVVHDEMYCDGGLLTPAPSEYGGTYAWCRVRDGQIIDSASGLFLTGPGMPTVENNLTEIIALTQALASLPDRWSGRLYSDNMNALQRAQGRFAMRNVPEEWKEKLFANTRRLGAITYVLLGGHPTDADLASGRRKKDGKPVSQWQRWCDKECCRLADEYWAAKGGSPTRKPKKSKAK